MRKTIFIVVALFAGFQSFAQFTFIDVHDMEPGKLTFDAVMAAHKKDLAEQSKYGVKFKKFWVDEAKGKVYCLATAKNANDITNVHAKAHGLLPSAIYKVSEGKEAKAVSGKAFFLDVHYLGAGNVTAKAAKGAHEKDLAVQKKYGVNFVNYWVDESSGTIFCLAQAPDSTAVTRAHKEAHGLLPAKVMSVKQGK